MAVTWHLCGYDRRTEFLGSDTDIPRAMLPAVRSTVPPKQDDPTFVDPRDLTPDQAVRLAVALGVTVDLDRFDYFVESQEDMASFLAKREARLARA